MTLQTGAANHERGDTRAVERVEELLQRQEQLFSQLDGLGEQQTALVEADDPERLLTLLAERQRLIDAIAATSGSLEPYRSRWSAFMGAIAEPERDRLRRRVDIIAELAGRIAMRDESHRVLLESRRTKVAAELGQVSRARGAVAAYGPAVRAVPRFQDREA